MILRELIAKCLLCQRRDIAKATLTINIMFHKIINNLILIMHMAITIHVATSPAYGHSWSQTEIYSTCSQKQYILNLSLP